MFYSSVSNSCAECFVAPWFWGLQCGVFCGFLSAGFGKVISGGRHGQFNVFQILYYLFRNSGFFSRPGYIKHKLAVEYDYDRSQDLNARFCCVRIGNLGGWIWVRSLYCEFFALLFSFFILLNPGDVAFWYFLYNRIFLEIWTVIFYQSKFYIIRRWSYNTHWYFFQVWQIHISTCIFQRNSW